MVDKVDKAGEERPISRQEPPVRAVLAGGDPYGTHRVVAPAGALPQPAWRLDNDFSRLFAGETLVAVDTLNLDAASFVQIEASARAALAAAGGPAKQEVRPERDRLNEAVAHIVLRTVAERGKQHNPVTGSGGMLIGRALQSTAGAGAGAAGDRIATLASLTLTPLRIDRIVAVHAGSGQIDVEGEAVLFASAPRAVLAGDIPARLALAVLDVAGAAPQVARLVRPGHVVAVLGAGGKSGILCVAEARRRGGAAAFIVGVEASAPAGEDLRELALCDAIVAADARDPVATRRAVLDATGGREADVSFSCVNVADAEMAAILCTRDRGTAYFFAMTTSFTKAALGAEGVGKDVNLFIGNGFAHGHAEHTLAMLREFPAVRALFERRYG